MYEAIIRRIDPSVTEAAGVVAAGQQFRMSTLRMASMRLQYSTLDHLPRSVFRDETRWRGSASAISSRRWQGTAHGRSRRLSRRLRRVPSADGPRGTNAGG